MAILDRLASFFQGKVSPQAAEAPAEPVPGVQTPQVVEPLDPEKLPEDLKAVVVALVKQLEDESKAPHRANVKRVAKAIEFWQGHQDGIRWDDQRGCFVPDASPVTDPSEELPYYVRNYYRAFGNTIISAGAKGSPTVTWAPKDPAKSADVQAAKQSDEVMSMFRDANRPERFRVLQWWHLWTGGMFAGRIRHRRDGARFGWSLEPKIEPVELQLTEDQHTCPACGAQQPVGYGVCLQCEGDLDETSITPGLKTTVPQKTGMQRVPNGQEVLDIHGLLEIRVAHYARDHADTPYLSHDAEFHVALLKAVFPDVAERLGKSATSEEESDRTERQTRMALAGNDDSDSKQQILTLKQTWLRPWAFNAVGNEGQRKRLQATYPDGMYIAQAGGVVCATSQESLDAHWRTCYATEGPGQQRHGIGHDYLPLQEAGNDLFNIELQTAEFGVPPTFADSQALNIPAFSRTPAKPATIYGLRIPSGKSARDMLFSPPPSAVSSASVQLRKETELEAGEYMTGATPALWGGEMGGAGETSSGYHQQHQYATGRLEVFWQQLTRFWVEIAPLVIAEFVANRTEDVSVSKKGLGGYKTSTISLEVLRNGETHARPEANEEFPVSLAQRRSALLALMAAKDPTVLAASQVPANWATYKSLIGFPDLVLPGEKAREQQEKEIAQMLQGQGPVMPAPLGPPAIGPDGMPVMPQPQSSLPIDPIFDRNDVHFQAVQDFLESDEGQELKVTNPAAHEDIRLHGIAHMQAEIQKQMAMAQAQQAMQPQPQGPGGPGPQQEAPPNA